MVFIMATVMVFIMATAMANVIETVMVPYDDLNVRPLRYSLQSIRIQPRCNTGTLRLQHQPTNYCHLPNNRTNQRPATPTALPYRLTLSLTFCFTASRSCELRAINCRQSERATKTMLAKCHQGAENNEPTSHHHLHQTATMMIDEGNHREQHSTERTTRMTKIILVQTNQ
jgi:hypothetical protein